RLDLSDGVGEVDPGAGGNLDPQVDPERGGVAFCRSGDLDAAAEVGQTVRPGTHQIAEPAGLSVCGTAAGATRVVVVVVSVDGVAGLEDQIAAALPAFQGDRFGQLAGTAAGGRLGMNLGDDAQPGAGGRHDGRRAGQVVD